MSAAAFGYGFEFFQHLSGERINECSENTT